MTRNPDAPTNTPHSSPFSSRRAARQATYRTHLLIAITGVLVLVFGLIHLPVYMSDGLVGWVDREESGIHLIGEMDVQETPDDAASTSAVNPEAPPTVQAATEPEGSSAEPGTGLGSTEQGGDAAATRSSRVVPLSALKTAKNTPEIVGGLGDFYLRIHYPEKARRAGIQGQLVLNFIVNEEGQTQNIHVEKSLHPLCDSSAVRALRETRFVPGEQNGQKVSVRMRLPVRFRLVGASSDAVADKSQHDSNSK
jgi:protein TonB